MPMTAYLNGQYMPLDEARVSPLDRGFLFGDGAYEVIPVYARRPFLLEQHLARLQRTLDGIALANPHSVAEWSERVQRVIVDGEFDDQSLYLQVTRGADSKRDQLRLVASPDGRDGSVTIRSDASLYVSLLGKDATVSHQVAAGRGLWLQVARGSVAVGDITLAEGDGLQVTNERALEIVGKAAESEILLFDLGA